MTTTTKWILGAALLSASITANATLIPFNSGALVDNTDNNTIWTADGNLFYTMAQASGNPTAFVQTIMAASGGVILDTPNILDTPANSGQFDLTASDFDTTTGFVDWYGAQAFVAYLNSIAYQGYSDWRQPSIIDSRSSQGIPGYGIPPLSPAVGELSQIFYVELGANYNTGSLLSTLNGYAALFVNLQATYYYGTESLVYAADGTWDFGGGNTANQKTKGKSYVWPVRAGQAPLAVLLSTLENQVNGILPEGLEDKATNAQNHLQAACTSLTNFVTQAQNQSGNKLSAPLAAQLSAPAVALENVIGCQ
jgi:hypothetical protein